MLYNYDSARLMLGIIFNKPNILISDKTPLIVEDFDQCLFHKILFKASVNLLNSGCESIDEIVLDQYLSNYESAYETCRDNNFMEFITTVKMLANIENAELYFNDLRKMTILRAYKKDGWDITPIYDETCDELNKLDSVTISDIINHFEGIQVEKRKKYNPSEGDEEIKAGEGFEDVKEGWKSTPYFGSMLNSEYMSTIWRGWCRGHLLLRSAPSGCGKTILAVADLCKVSATRLWDKDKHCFVENTNIDGGALFINTELDLVEEVTPCFVACISGVERYKILDGRYEDDEEERVDEAIRILQESEIYLIDMPDFTLRKLEEAIKDYSINKNVTSVWFDYVQFSGAVAREIASGTTTREDMVLLSLTAHLKQWAKKYNVRIGSGTQCNANINVSEIIDESCLAGGRSQKNKVDGGCVILEPRRKELQEVESLIDKKGFGEHLYPTHVTHVYKSRFGKYNRNLKVWQHVNLGTGEVVDLFCTTWDNKPFKVERTRIE